MTVNFSINKTNEPAQSDLNVTWNVDCIVVDKEISDYYMVYSKSDSKRKANPIATIKSENEDYVANIKEMNTGIYNCFLAGLQPGKLPVNRYFHATIELNNYYRFVWEDYDTLMVNTNLYGKSVDKIDIVLTCDDIRISNAIISIYEVNPDNLHKKFIQYLKYTNENGIHTFSFSSNKIKPKCLYLILIPKCE